MTNLSQLIVSKRFAGELHNISDFVTPKAFEVEELFKSIQRGCPYDSIADCWSYLNAYVKYPLDHRGRHTDRQKLISFGGAFTYNQPSDFWLFPSELLARARWAAERGQRTLGDCADVATAMVSLMRNQLDSDEIYVAIGIYSPPGKQPGGHAWVKFLLDNEWYYADPTVTFGNPLNFDLYEEGLLFNDNEINEINREMINW